MFEGGAPIKPTTGSNAKAPLRCSEVFGKRFDDIQSPYAQLNDHCRETAKAIVQKHLGTLTAALNSSDLTIEDLARDSELDFNQDSQRAASQLDLRDQARRYVRDLNAKRTKLVNSRMNKVIESMINTKSGDTAVLDALCKDAKHFKDLEQVCRQFRKTLAE